MYVLQEYLHYGALYVLFYKVLLQRLNVFTTLAFRPSLRFFYHLISYMLG